MDWLLIGLALAFVGVAIWLWRSAQSGLVSLGRIWKGRTVGTAVAYCPVCGQPQHPSWDHCPYCAQRDAQQAAAVVAAPPPPPSTPPPVFTEPVAPQLPAAPPPRMEKTEILRPAQPQELAWLVLLSGTHAGMEFRQGEITTIGRDPSCDIVLDDTTASRQHAQVRLEGQTFTIYDLGSASGTYVNNRSIGRARLIDSDRIQIGQTVLIFKQVDRGLVRERRED
ncbi:MAG TPA: FHA domain-containing protein, partial [Chloroflexi bacterium]|nr:FHA domain-containing protein [Chloroflexota bacterium]